MAQITDLRGRLDEHRLVAVVGGSGVGKSSLVYAGLMPKLDDERGWSFIELKPRGKPRKALAEAFIDMLAATGLIDPDDMNSAPLADHVWTTLSRSALGLVDLARDWLPQDVKRIFILVDQFEEVFRFEQRPGQLDGAQPIEDDPAAFVSLLLRAAEAESLPIHVMLTMRADYIGDCIRFEGLPEAISDGQYLVPRLNREQLESVIREPMTRAAGGIDHDLVEQLLNDCAKAPDALPVLQHVLMRLWEQAGTDGARPAHTGNTGTNPIVQFAVLGGERRLTMDLYASLGGMRDALSRHADNVIQELADGLLRDKAILIAEQLMRALTEVDHEGRAIRRPVQFGQLVEETGFPEQEVKIVIDAMRAETRSFIRPDTEATLTTDTVIDISHEALIRLWRKVEDPDAPDQDGRPTGWLRDEERDSRVFRALLEHSLDFERTGNLLAPAYAASRLRWWKERPRSEAWARRYGGGTRSVERLLNESIADIRDGRGYKRELATLPDALREVVLHVSEKLRGSSSQEDLNRAKALVEELRDINAYEIMGRLTEAVSRHDPTNAKACRLYAQYLSDSNMASAAIALLRPLVRRLPRDHPEFARAALLLGRAYTQIFYDASDRKTPSARNALSHAIKILRGVFEKNPTYLWHGVHLVALLARARSLGLRVAPDLDPKRIAREVIARLEQTPGERREDWFLPALAEAWLALDEWDRAEQALRAYVFAPDIRPSQIASTVQRLVEVWDLEGQSARGHALVDILRSRLVAFSQSQLTEQQQRLRHRREGEQVESKVTSSDLVRVFGSGGPQTYRWWRTGIDRATSIASLRERGGNRIATGFLVRAGDLGLEPGEELLVLTTYYAVNNEGAFSGLRPEDAEFVFEAADPDRHYMVKEIVWSSPVDRHDASLLRLQEPVTGIAPLPIARALPVVESAARVYIIGHAGGRDLAFSFQDNELLDHEGPPLGKPQIEGVIRVHYRAPTEGGSGGSPVFNSRLWEVIALHHKGGKMGMPKLNGLEGTYGANEGIAIQSIAAAIKGAR